MFVSCFTLFTETPGSGHFRDGSIESNSQQSWLGDGDDFGLCEWLALAHLNCCVVCATIAVTETCFELNVLLCAIPTQKGILGYLLGRSLGPRSMSVFTSMHVLVRLYGMQGV